MSLIKKKKETRTMARTARHKEYNKEWKAKNNKVLGCMVRVEEADQFRYIAQLEGMTISGKLLKYVRSEIDKYFPPEEEAAENDNQ